MSDQDRPGGDDHRWVDPERREGAVTDKNDNYSGQGYTREGEEALGEVLPSGTVTSDPSVKPDPDAAENG